MPAELVSYLTVEHYHALMGFSGIVCGLVFWWIAGQ